MTICLGCELFIIYFSFFQFLCYSCDLKKFLYSNYKFVNLIIFFSQSILTKTRGEPIILFHKIAHEKLSRKILLIQFDLDFEYGKKKHIDEWFYCLHCIILQNLPPEKKRSTRWLKLLININLGILMSMFSLCSSFSILI